MRISDWSSDVCSSDLGEVGIDPAEKGPPPKSALKAQAKAHSKQIRKARRGERRSRTAESKPTDLVGKPKPKAKAKPGKTGQPAPGQTTGKKQRYTKHPPPPPTPRKRIHNPPHGQTRNTRGRANREKK